MTGLNIDQNGPRELTLRVILIGIVLSVVMGAANVYLGLKVGLTVSASIPAAVLAMIVLRGLFRNGTILESNQVQTAASAGESLAAGIIFTMPALIIIGIWQEFDWFLTTAVAFTGGLLGILFMIPMRRVFVTARNQELKFPEGVACAAVLRAGEESGEGKGQGAMRILWGGLLGGGLKFAISFLGLIKGVVEGAGWFGHRVFYFGGDVSPALVAVGFIVGMEVALHVFVGGAIAWIIAIPILSGGLDGSENALDVGWTLWSTKIRYIGVGAMVVGGVSSIVKVRHGLLAAVRELKKSAGMGVLVKGDSNPLDRDLPSGIIKGLACLSIVLVVAVYYYLTNHVGMTLIISAIMIVMSFFFTAVASYVVGLVGNSNSPVSGMTITAVLFTGGVLYVLGFSGISGMVATLGVAAIVCCAACTAGDVCNDLKTGQLVGASPFKQQIMQIIGVAVAAVVMMPVLQLLHTHTPGGIGGRELAAPQAALFASLASGFFGDGVIPWDMVSIGLTLGVVILFVDGYLQKSGASFRAHIMPIAVGTYLPFGLAVPMLIGGVMAYLVTRGSNQSTHEERVRGGVLFSSGVIAGESLMGVGLAILASLGLTRMKLNISDPWTMTLTSLAIVFCIWFFWIFSRKKIDRSD